MTVDSWLQHAVVPLAIALIAAVALERSRIRSALPGLLTLLSALNVIVLIALVINHVRYPFHLDVMEGVVMQHARRALHGQAIYPLPSPEFVPLAYNTLFYLLATPFLRLLGDTLPTLRVVSVVGFVGCAVAIFFLVREYARSAWWGAIAVGLFCAAYAAMDAYLDTAHSDAWMLCSALWGTYLVGRDSRGARVSGILVLIAAFWFKQHGAVFLVAALLFLTWREGPRSALVYWLPAIALGPLLFLFPPESIVGADFHYFTWQVPHGWSQFTVHSVIRVVSFARHNYPVLAIASLAWVYQSVRAKSIGILDVQLGAAFLTALMGSLDPGSSNNVFIPMGAFSILGGSIALARFNESGRTWLGVRPALLGALLAFATLLRDPREYWLPASAASEYADLQSTIRALPGTLYAPGIGQLSDGPQLYPAAHWVALEDMVRGSHRTAADTARARQTLDPLRHPAGAAFILTNRPLTSMPVPVNELATSYGIVQDYGSRFQSLRTLPRPFDSGYPRYLYRYNATGATPLGH